MKSAQYARVQLHGVNYLLPGDRLFVETRDALEPNTDGGQVIAWRNADTGRWPVFAVDRAFALTSPRQWQKAVFVGTDTAGIGLIADDVQLLSRSDIQLSPFAPLGPPATEHGHLFNGAWVEGRAVTLVLDAKVMVAYLGGFNA